MKKLILLHIFFFFALSIMAQQDAYSWRVGAYCGFNFYRGDLNSDLNPLEVSHPLNDFSYENRFDLLSYGASIEYATKGFGLKLLATRGIFRAEDRAMNRDGNFISHANFNRALNVENQLYDAAILATFYSDNGRLLSKMDIVSPYISVGIGGTAFQTFGDIEDENGTVYNYWSDGKIYNYPEMALPPIAAEELTRDFVYETDLETLDPEGVFYPNLVWNIPIAIGLKFRITERLNANLEVIGRYTSTDYLDGVSTRGNSDDNDFYGMTSLSLHYNFGRKSEDFLPPTFYSLEEKSTETTPTDSLENKPKLIDPKPIDAPQKQNKVATKPTRIISKKSIYEEYREPKVRQPSNKVILKSEQEQVSVQEPVVNEPKTNLAKAEKDIVKTKSEELRAVEVVKKVDTLKSNNVEFVEDLNISASDLNLAIQEQLYIDVQKTRLEVAELTENVNTLLNGDNTVNSDTIAMLNKQIDALNKEKENYQQWLINLAIQGNANYTKPENQAIETQVSVLEKETEALRKKYRLLVLGQQKPETIESELENIQKENEENKAKIKALEAEVEALEKQQEAKLLKSSIIDEIEIIEVESVDTSQAVVIDSTVNNAIIPVMSDSVKQVVNDYEKELEKLSNEINRLTTEVIPQKDQTIQFLNTKVVELKGELKGIKETNKYYADLFQQQIAALQKEVEKLNKQQTVTSKTPKVVERIVEVPTEPKVIEKVVEKVIEVPTTPAKNVNLQDLVKEFGITNVYFDNGSIVVKSEFNGQLNRVASMMKQHPEVIVILKGYTDKSGNPKANLKLSKKRGESVKSYLLKQGISADRINITYFGENAASAVNDAFSRRVEVQMIIDGSFTND